MQRTSIEWTNRSSNGIRARHKATGKVGWHCVHHGPGCLHCYAEALNRWRGTGLPYTAGAEGQVEMFLDERPLAAILRLKLPQRIFMFDMTDWAQKAVPDEMIVRCFALMAMADWHTFQLLTKRSERMRDLLNDPSFPYAVGQCIDTWGRELIEGNKIRGDWSMISPIAHDLKHGRGWPLANVWEGVSVEDRKHGLPRVDHLRETPAALRFLSVEPLLEDLGPLDLAGIDWVIVGGESGPKAWPMHPQWARSIRDQCQAAGVPFFFKQWGGWAEDGQTPGVVGGPQAGATWWLEDDPDGEFFELDRDSFAVNPGVALHRYGKKAAGRLLDGRTWDEFPAAYREVATP